MMRLFKAATGRFRLQVLIEPWLQASFIHSLDSATALCPNDPQLDQRAMLRSAGGHLGATWVWVDAC
ncbi:hypothetical protein CgunFtcFv8_008180 [Champsocephalus gunnari]|uniref:Uncharacterized protein n=1 Tax=Champsocephalus gunnari TaxID=52237 RepID=A0AAN8D4M7_CHAGU|nr:hypothetical protein CgunFtcFv8_008180 [Champsocephalus gunnari]